MIRWIRAWREAFRPRSDEEQRDHESGITWEEPPLPDDVRAMLDSHVDSAIATMGVQYDFEPALKRMASMADVSGMSKAPDADDAIELRLLRAQLQQWKDRALAAEDFAETLLGENREQRRVIRKALLAMKVLRDPTRSEIEKEKAFRMAGGGA